MIIRDYSHLPPTDEGRSELCLFELLKFLYGPVNERYRLQAANLILRYCAPKPFRNARLSPEEVKDWLETLSPNET